MKKPYRKPEITVRTVALGIYGDYAEPVPGGQGSDGGDLLSPYKRLTDRNLHAQ